MAKYDASSIKVLKGLEGVRKRPAMYIAGLGPDGYHQLLFEILDNAVDEALAGYADAIEVTLHADGSASVADNGRGIPVDLMPGEGRPAVEVIYTELHAGGKFDSGAYKVSGGLHGVGASVVNALSEWTVVEVFRDGKHYRIAFSRGEVAEPLHEVGDLRRAELRLPPGAAAPPGGELPRRGAQDHPRRRAHRQEGGLPGQGRGGLLRQGPRRGGGAPLRAAHPALRQERRDWASCTPGATTPRSWPTPT